MTKFIFENWPDTEKGLRVAMVRLVDDGRTYKEAVDAAKKAYLRAVLLKMRGKSKQAIAKRCGFWRTNLIHLIKKYDLV